MGKAFARSGGVETWREEEPTEVRRHVVPSMAEKEDVDAEACTALNLFVDTADFSKNAPTAPRPPMPNDNATRPIPPETLAFVLARNAARTAPPPAPMHVSQPSLAPLASAPHRAPSSAALVCCGALAAGVVAGGVLVVLRPDVVMSALAWVNVLVRLAVA